jgi:hypothetical protein
VDGTAQARRTFRWLLALALSLVGLALGDYLHAMLTGEAFVSGLGTAVVPRF